jgi:hypothetical protein
MFEHFVITVFNLLQFPKSRNLDTATWTAWTKDRFVIFQDYCLPSMIHQINKNFKWLIYFDAATPSEFDDQINNLKQYDFINICYANGYDDFQLRYCEDIRLKVSPAAKWIITSRLDNDDCIHRQAIQRIQDEFVPKDRFMVSLALGYVYDLESRKLSKYYYPAAPFSSLVEDREHISGIYHKDHTQWDILRLYIFKELYSRYFVKKEKWKASFVLDDALWMQICHQKNISNSFYRGFPVLKALKLNDFGISCTSQPSSISDIPKYCNYVIWKRYFKAICVRILGKALKRLK